MDYDHKPSPFMDSPFTYDSLTLDPYQYSGSPFTPMQMGLSVPAPGTPPSIFNQLNLSSNLTDFPAYPPSYTSTSTTSTPGTPPDGIPLPAVGNYSLSAVDSDSTQSSRHSRKGSVHSPVSSHGLSYAASVPRSHRFNPIAQPPATRRNSKRKNSIAADVESDDEDDDFNPHVTASTGPDSRREVIRKQRIESEQRRRDELREGYARLRDTLPASNQKASKVSLLDRATTHIRYLDTVRDQLEARLKAAESEIHRLRSVNEALMLGTAEQRHAAAVAAVQASAGAY